MSRYAGDVLRAAKAFAGETVESVVQRTYELHRRYGVEVEQVVDSAIRKYAPAIREKALASGCLLRAVIADDRIKVDRTPLEIPIRWGSDDLVEQASDNRDFRSSTWLQLAVDGNRKQLVIDGLGDVGTEADFELVSILAARYREDRRAELKADNYQFVTIQRLMDALSIDDESALRQRISKFRRRLFDMANERWGIPLSRNAVVENKSGAGYRLNPDIRLINLREMK